MKTQKFFIYFILLAVMLTAASCRNIAKSSSEITISKDKLLDKIKGGWAGQTIGCTYGGPTEFRYAGTMIQDYIPIKYDDGCIKWYYDNAPGLYDDIYMDLTFVDIFDKYGLDAPVEKFAFAFANADYSLWHANQAARYNILNGIMPPKSGNWKYNPHANDIDFQIEADFAGLMSPGMINTAVQFTDKIGHIMNYGDGWYGGVYVAAMYALAFVYDDMETIVHEAIKVIPQQSRYYKCINDVIRWHKKYPDDWRQTWAECEKKWSSDIGCPDGVFTPFNIDATLNSAYVTIGLLYGQGDFFKTMEIATRCGQDSDCNPATAAGILGTMIGYSNIPEKWMPNLREVEDRNFAYTDISLNKAYKMSFDQALQVIEKNGGKVNEDAVVIKCQIPATVGFEECFTDHWPVDIIHINKNLIENPINLNFKGKGIVISYNMNVYGKDYTGEIEITLDGKIIGNVMLPNSYKARKCELFSIYELENKEHHLKINWLNPNKTVGIRVTSAVIYDEKPIK